MKVILAQPRGFCAGVVRAIEIVERALEKYGPPVYVRHEIVHNKHVVESLKAKGARFVEESVGNSRRTRSRSSAPMASPRSVEDEAAARDLPVLDATCPLVTKVHNQGKRYVAQGRTLILIGHAGHPEVEGTHGPDSRRRCILVQTEEDVDALDIPTDTPVAYVTQTTLSVDDTRGIIAALQRALQRHRRPGDARHLLRDAEPPDGGARTQQACRRHPGGRRQEQLEFQPAARDRRGGGRPELSDRRRQRARARMVRGRRDGRHHRRRLGARGAGRGRDRRAAPARPGRSLDAARARRESFEFRLPAELAAEYDGTTPSSRRATSNAGRSRRWRFRSSRKCASAPICSSRSCWAASAIRWC